MIDAALAQIPDEHEYGTAILVRTDGAGGSMAWLPLLRSLREDGGLDVEYSVGFTMTEHALQAMLALPEVA